MTEYSWMPVPGTGGDKFRLADRERGECRTCSHELVGFTFARVTGWLCPACDVEHYSELEKLGARHCATCEHTECEHWDTRFAPACAVLSCHCGAFK